MSQDEKLNHRQEESFNVLSELSCKYSHSLAKVGRAGVSSRVYTFADLGNTRAPLF